MVGYYSYVLADMDDGLGIVVLMNGPGGQSDVEIANLALKLLRAALHDQELPPVPPTDPTRVENGADYGGTYQARPVSSGRADTKPFTLAAQGERLMLRYGDASVVLELRGLDRFYVDHPDFALFLLRFEREKGEVVEAFHGPNWCTNERYTGPTTFDYPEEWRGYPGHYCSHNPWLTNFRVVLRKGALALIYPSGNEEPLAPLGDGIFRVGEEERSPERIRFDTILNGQALRANLSCGDCYRTFTR